MQHAAPDVGIDEQRAMPAIRKGVRQVCREERFAVPRPRARDRDEERRPPPVRVHEVQAHAPEGFHDLVDVLGHTAPAMAPRVGQRAQVRHGAQDRKAHLARHLIGVADSGINAVEKHGTEQPQSEARDEPEHDDARRRVAHRALWHDGMIQDAHVGHGARLGEARLLEARLQRRVEILGEGHAAAQPRLLDGPRRDGPQAARVRVEAP